MTLKKTAAFVIFLSVSALAGCPASAYEIYQWVDADGVIHFSQVKPEKVAEVRTLRIPARNSPDYDPDDDPYSIRNQAERTSELWSELEERKNARSERMREAAERAARYAPPDYQTDYYYSSLYRYRPVHRVHPIHRPPPFKTQRRQFTALDKLGLDSSNRPHSINSSAHHARINRSIRSLHATRPGPKPQPPKINRPGRPPAIFELH